MIASVFSPEMQKPAHRRALLTGIASMGKNDARWNTLRQAIS